MRDSTRSSSGGEGADHLWVTILAGGVGSRFWPASTPQRPKQLLPIAGERPLLAETLERARSLVPADRIRVLTGPDLVEAVAEVWSEIDPTEPPEGLRNHILVEPEAKGTAPPLIRAAWEILRIDPEAVLVSLHSDHRIEPLEAFVHDLVGAATAASEHSALVALGATPTRPDPGFGYMVPGPALGTGPANGPGRWVERFVEKPSLELAEELIGAGAVWNTGIFVWQARVFLEEVRRVAPETAQALDTLDRSGVDAFFAAVPAGVVDRVVLERSERVALSPASFHWDDVGSWEALARIRPPDALGNVTVGRTRVLDGSGNLVWCEEGEAVLLGVDDLVVVRSGETLLVTRRERAAEVGEIPDRIQDGGGSTTAPTEGSAE